MTKKEVRERVNKYISQIYKGIISETPIKAKLYGMNFFEAPASTKYHGAYVGGLAEHSLNVTDTLVKLTEDNQLKWYREESPIIVGLFHDLCKCDSYIVSGTHYDETGVEHPNISWNSEQCLEGHGDKSVMIASTLLTLTAEEMFCIRYHMGAYVDKSEWSRLGKAIKLFPNILWTHHADMIATYCMEE